MIGLSLCQEGMNPGIAPLLLRCARPVSRAPSRKPSIVHLPNVSKRDPCCLGLGGQRLGLRKLPSKPGRVAGCATFNSFIGFEGAIGCRVLVRHALAPADFSGPPCSLGLGEPCKVFIGFQHLFCTQKRMAKTRRLRGGRQPLMGAPISYVGAPVAQYTVSDSGDSTYTLPAKGGGCGCLAQNGGYRATAKNRAMLRKYRAGKSIGFTGIASLKAKGLLPRTSRKNRGKKIVGPKYR